MFEHDLSYGKVFPDFKRALETYRAVGLGQFVMYGLQFVYIRTVRILLPGTRSTKYVTGLDYSDVLIDKPRKPLDWLFPRFRLSPTRELGLRLAHTFVTRPGDRVVIIGGGEGLTAIVAARIVGPSGRVHVYDGLTGDDNNWFGVSIILNNARVNHLNQRISAEWAFVTPRDKFVDVDMYDKEGTVPPILRPKDLMECDVLEMDLNGAELEILEHMTIRPRVIIFELEAPYYKGYYKNPHRHPFEIFSVLEQIGYSVIKQTGHEGINLTKDDLIKLVELQYQTEAKVTLHNGAKDSPVLYAVRNDAVLTSFAASDRPL